MYLKRGWKPAYGHGNEHLALTFAREYALSKTNIMNKSRVQEYSGSSTPASGNCFTCKSKTSIGRPYISYLAVLVRNITDGSGVRCQCHVHMAILTGHARQISDADAYHIIVARCDCSAQRPVKMLVETEAASPRFVSPKGHWSHLTMRSSLPKIQKRERT